MSYRGGITQQNNSKPPPDVIDVDVCKVMRRKLVTTANYVCAGLFVAAQAKLAQTG